MAKWCTRVAKLRSMRFVSIGSYYSRRFAKMVLTFEKSLLAKAIVYALDLLQPFYLKNLNRSPATHIKQTFKARGHRALVSGPLHPSHTSKSLSQHRHGARWRKKPVELMKYKMLIELTS